MKRWNKSCSHSRSYGLVRQNSAAEKLFTIVGLAIALFTMRRWQWGPRSVLPEPDWRLPCVEQESFPSPKVARKLKPSTCMCAETTSSESVCSCSDRSMWRRRIPSQFLLLISLIQHDLLERMKRKKLVVFTPIAYYRAKTFHILSCGVWKERVAWMYRN